MVIPSQKTGKSSRPSGNQQKRTPAEKQRPPISNRWKVKYILMAAILIVLTVWTAFSLTQTEEKRVKKTFRLLSDAMMKESGESIFTLDQKIKKIASLVADTCEIKLPAYGLSGKFNRDEMTGYVVRGRIHFSNLHIKFLDFDITFPEADVSKVRLTARVTGRTTPGETVNEAYEIECLLKKMEKRWIVNSIETIEVLKK